MTYLHAEEYKEWIKEKKIKTFKQALECPECSGELETNGEILTSNPPWFPHVCRDCGYTANLRDKFPRVVYKEVNDD
jgi:uncharacterized Zn finger protein